VEISAVNLENLYSSLKDVIRPPLRKPAETEPEPIVVAAFKELCYWTVKAFGWEFEGDVPEDLEKAVIIVAPHTSLFDFVIGMAAYRHFKEFKGFYLAKKELFEGPMKYLYEKTGGIPVDRAKHHNLVDQVSAFFDEYERFFLAMAPEGTRSHTDKWKSGFYRIALKADVPIMLGFFDFERKVAGIGDIIYPTGDYEADARKIEAFYKTITPFWEKKWNWNII